MTTAIITAALIVALAILTLAAVITKAEKNISGVLDKNDKHDTIRINAYLQALSLIIHDHGKTILAASLLFPDNLRNGDMEAAMEKADTEPCVVRVTAADNGEVRMTEENGEEDDEQ